MGKQEKLFKESAELVGAEEEEEDDDTADISMTLGNDSLTRPLLSAVIGMSWWFCWDFWHRMDLHVLLCNAVKRALNC